MQLLELYFGRHLGVLEGGRGVFELTLLLRHAGYHDRLTVALQTVLQQPGQLTIPDTDVFLPLGQILYTVPQHQQRLIDLLAITRLFTRGSGVAARQVDETHLAIGGLVLHALLLVTLVH